jgi:hypothetical protein
MSALRKLIDAEAERLISEYQNAGEKKRQAEKGTQEYADARNSDMWTFGALLSLQRILRQIGSPSALKTYEKINQILDEEEGKAA